MSIRSSIFSQVTKIQHVCLSQDFNFSSTKNSPEIYIDKRITFWLIPLSLCALCKISIEIEKLVNYFYRKNNSSQDVWSD